jgi:glycosyltransferase involved in cell wall biosynthesis
MTILTLYLNKEIRTGGQKRYLELVKGLQKKGHTLLLLIREGASVDPEDVPFLHIPLESSLTLPKAFQYRRAVGRVYPEIQKRIGVPDWIIIFGETHLLAASLLKHKSGAKLLYGHRSNAVREALIAYRENRRRPASYVPLALFLLKSRIYEKLITHLSDRIVVQSSFDRDDFQSREPRSVSRLYVIRGNIGEPRFKAEYAFCNSSTKLSRVLFIGTFGERKGVRLFLEAARRLLKEKQLDICFDIVGFGDLEAWCTSFVHQAGITDRISFHGRLANPFPLLIESDLLVVPSLFDSYPNTVLEALHVGTPVIASRTGGIPDILQHKELLFPIGDVYTIAEMIARFHSDREEYRRVKELCRDRRERFLFDWEQKFIDLMQMEKNDGVIR